MRTATPFWAVAVFTASCIFSIFFGLTNKVNDSLQLVDEKIHFGVLLFFIGTCLYRILDGHRLASVKKITQFDCICLTVHNSFALLELATCFILYYLGSENRFFQPALVLRDWCLFPFFFWILAWSRFIRRGWSSILSKVVILLSTFGHLFCLIHFSVFYFLLGLTMVLSCLTTYETYKLHFYRRQVSQLFFALLLLIIIFYLVRLNFALNVFNSHSRLLTIYAYVTLFTLITALTNRLHLRILIEVNELR